MFSFPVLGGHPEKYVKVYVKYADRCPPHLLFAYLQPLQTLGVPLYSKGNDNLR